MGRCGCGLCIECRFSSSVIMVLRFCSRSVLKQQHMLSAFLRCMCVCTGKRDATPGEREGQAVTTSCQQLVINADAKQKEYITVEGSVQESLHLDY